MIFSVIVVIVGIDQGYLAMTGDTSAWNAVLANPSLLLEYGGTLVGYLLQGASTWSGQGLRFIP